MTEECGAVKHGIVDLRCSNERGHDKAQEGQPATWHRAVFLERREVDYPGAHHVLQVTETVTWEPVDHTAEAVRHMLAGTRRQADAPLVTATQERRPSTETGLITEEEAEGEEQPDLLALVDKATRDHADVGLPGEIRRANANRAAAGLGPLSVPGGEITFTPVGYQGPAQHTYTTGCDGFHEPGQCPRADRIEADGCECGSPTCRRGPAPVGADVDL